MHQVSLQQAVKMTGKSESTLRRAIKKGSLSATRDTRGHYQFDQSELRRVFGELLHTGESDQSTQSTDLALTTPDQSYQINVLENHITDLRNQLDIANREKASLLDLLTAETAERRALLPPPKQPKRNWFASLFSLPATPKHP